MVYHILNGDSLAFTFRDTNFVGEIIVIRECLIEGDLNGETIEEFWQHRAAYIRSAYQAPEEKYYAEVVREFEKIMTAQSGTEFNLWFGYDLFCRVNMWFVTSLLCS